MYEAEVNYGKEPINSLPSEIRQKFNEFRTSVVARTILPWGEHCTECVWPSCYSTCALYDRRTDGACRQFVGSAVRLDNNTGLNPYVLKLQFKRWAKFWTVGNLDLKTLTEAESEERKNIAVGALARNLILPFPVKSRVLSKVNYLRRVAAEKAPEANDRPDCFLLECYNPGTDLVHLTFTVRLKDRSVARRYEKNIEVSPGYLRAKIPFREIASVIDIALPFELEIVPNNVNESTTLYFGLMDFIRESPATPHPTSQAKPIKCVIWDLDNTLWDGILVENGIGGIRLREPVVDVIKEIDRRGILLSVASKNNQEDALGALRHFGLEEYFLYPQINWGPKSHSVTRIAKSLNIGLDSIVFVDDQTFEREEVRSSVRSVFTLDATDFSKLPNMPGCQLPVTEESRRRRQMYREQAQREEALETGEEDYLEFLRSCRMQVSIGSLNETNVERVYELAQRTNQMNFSGNRYQLEELKELAEKPSIRTLVISCRDRFGDYGIVGFAVIDLDTQVLLDLMFSCRVQSKRVEHAILTYLLHDYVAEKERDFYVSYRRSSRNAASGVVFEEVGFELAKERGDVSLLVFRFGKPIPDDEIVEVYAEAVSGAVR
jgi:FkbH-like protein